MLPVHAIFDSLSTTLVHDDVILLAPPGAGKSTYLPLQLLAQPQFTGQRIILLQPRRVAVKTIAYYLAKQLNQPVGNTVGYRIKGETKVSPHTRLEVVTEGVLVRMLQSDPELSGIGLVIFDEFHERSLAADFSLALCQEVRSGLRDDLRLLVMSATLQGMDFSNVLANGKTIVSEGRQFAVDIQYRGTTAIADMVSSIARLMLHELASHSGNVLIFLPTKRLINQLCERLQSLPEHWTVCPLFGGLSIAEQQQAIAAPAAGQKVVVSTNIAETSLTIEGIDLVIDAGLVNQAQFSLRTGDTRLSIEMSSQSSSVQRTGRAGRLAPGKCIRMWSQESHHRRPQQSTPAIFREDITDIVLQAALWGSDLSQLPLLEAPKQVQVDYARQQLQFYQALDQQGKLTAKGRQLAEVPGTLAIANMLLFAKQQATDLLPLACATAAIIEAGERQSSLDFSAHVEQAILRRHGMVWQQVKHWQQRLNCTAKVAFNAADLTQLLLRAYPHRVAYRMNQQDYKLVGGGRVTVNDMHLAKSQWLLVVDLYRPSEQSQALVSAAIALNFESIEKAFQSLLVERQICEWQNKQLRVTRAQCFGEIVYHESAVGFSCADDRAKQQAWQWLINQQGLSFLPWHKGATEWLARLNMVRQWLPELDLPDLTQAKLLEDWKNWLYPVLSPLQKLSQCQQLDLLSLVQQRVDWQLQQQVNQLCPTHYTAPTGRKVPIRYQNGRPILAIRLQEMFGVNKHPCIAKGRVPIILELLSPANRPIQTTADLPAFWQGSYAQVRADLRGRYIKHYWPDTPETAKPTTRTKNKM